MKITLRNNKGLIIRRIQIANKSVNLQFRWNNIDEFWYISIPGLIDGIRVSPMRPIKLKDGYFIAEGETGKTTFNEITWIEYD